ncbi:MAG: Cohesin domain protein, partial [Ruminococcus sp.]|nr:Cohesin domain protein [Ruminococcus sp.]
AVNIADLTMISRYVAEDTDLSITANGKANADVNRDNEVNAMDINALALKLAIE